MEALALEEALQRSGAEAMTLDSLGVAYQHLGELPNARRYYVRSLLLQHALQDPLGEGYVLSNLMRYSMAAHNPRLAVLFGKQAIDRYQQLRQNLVGLANEDQQSFLKSNLDDYRELAELLISDGRLTEAEQVVDLLKIAEYSQFTQLRGTVASGSSRLARTPQERNAEREYSQITADITTIGEQWTQLRGKSHRSADEDKRFAELSHKLTVVNFRFERYMNGLYSSFGKGAQANARMETVGEETGSLQTLVRENGSGTAAVYALVLDQKCVLIVITSATRVARDVPIGKIALRGKVFALSNALAGHHSDGDIQAKAQELYSILVAPIEKDLEGAHVVSLVWSLDDVLRYVPLGALYDGKQYLIERYRNTVITTASLVNLRARSQDGSWRGVAMGISKNYNGLGELKAVPEELSSVIHSDATAGSRGPVPGTILLNDSFTETNMETELEKHPSLVHIASHYVFSPEGDEYSYLLLGGKDTGGGQGYQLTLAELRDDPRIDLTGVDLLTLSACETAKDAINQDGREINGLAITAQTKGAKAVVASLWNVDDTSVGRMMATFYKLWVASPGMTKAEALRQAQLLLLRGSDSTLHISDPPGERAASQYSNPFYWAPFVLIGNWR